MKNILLQADLLEPATNTTVTIRMSAVYADSRGVLVNDIEWLPVIITGPTTSITVFSNGQPQAAEIEYGDIQFLMHPEMGNNHWSHLDWTSADISIWTGAMGAAWAEYTQIYAGKCGPIERDGLTGQIALVGNEAILEANLLTGEYAGTGGSQGAAGLRGNPRPMAFGLCENIAPVLIDQAYQVYQFHDGQADDVLMVYDNALEVAETAVATVSSYVELCALSLEPGEWAKAPAVGMFRLGGAPNGKLTADVRGHSRDGLYFNTIGIIVPEILKISGIDPAKIDMASIGAFEQEWSLYLTSQTTCGEAVICPHRVDRLVC